MYTKRDIVDQALMYIPFEELSTEAVDELYSLVIKHNIGITSSYMKHMIEAIKVETENT